MAGQKSGFNSKCLNSSCASYHNVLQQSCFYNKVFEEKSCFDTNVCQQNLSLHPECARKKPEVCFETKIQQGKSCFEAKKLSRIGLGLNLTFLTKSLAFCNHFPLKNLSLHPNCSTRKVLLRNQNLSRKNLASNLKFLKKSVENPLTIK